MWRVVGFLADGSDSEFVVWTLLAERDDGRIQSVRVKVDRISFAKQQSTVEGSASNVAREAIQTQGRSLIEQNQSEKLSPSYVFGVGGFVAEWD